MVTRPSTTEFNTLLNADEYRDHGAELELTPAGAERLALGLRWAETRGRKVRVSRARFNAVGEPDITSCLIRAEAEARIVDVEAALGRAQLTLGALSPAARKLKVGAWLTGPYCGLRAVPGGRLEPAALTLEAVLWNGEVYRSHASPRSAAGPDLDHALLGGDDAVGLLTSAVLRAAPKPTTEDRVSIALGEPSQAAAILHDALAHEAVPAHAEVRLVDGRAVLTATFANLAFRAHRDAARLREASTLNGASPLEAAVSKTESAALHEVEVSWEALPGLLGLASKHRLELHRIARESVIVAAPIILSGDGVVSQEMPGPKPAWLHALAASLRGGR